MSDGIEQSAPKRSGDTKAYGGLLLGSALLSVLAAMHHPAIEAHDLATVVRTLGAEAGMIAGVHGALLAIFIAQSIGLYGLARTLGLGRPLPAAGLALLGLGTMAMVAAAAINGFAVPAFATSYRSFAPAEAPVVAAVLRMSWACNQAWASIGAVAWGGAILLWSIALLPRAGWPRAVGLIGLVAALVIAAGVTTGLVHLDVTGFILVTALLAAWSIAVALLMLTGRILAQP